MMSVTDEILLFKHLPATLNTYTPNPNTQNKPNFTVLSISHENLLINFSRLYYLLHSSKGTVTA